MSDSRKRKFIKLFGQQIPSDETLINYFSCALVSTLNFGDKILFKSFVTFRWLIFCYKVNFMCPKTTFHFIQMYSGT